MQRQARLIDAIQSFCDAITSTSHSFSLDDLETLFREFIEADQNQLEEQLSKELERVLRRIDRMASVLAVIKDDFGRQSNELALRNGKLRRKVRKREKQIAVKKIIWQTQVRKIEEIRKCIRIDLPVVRRSLRAKMREVGAFMYETRSDIAALASNNLVTMKFARQMLGNAVQAIEDEKAMQIEVITEEINELSVSAARMKRENTRLSERLLEALLLVDEEASESVDAMVDELIEREKSDAILDELPIDCDSLDDVGACIAQYVRDPIEEAEAVIADLSRGFAMMEDAIRARMAKL